ncbi:hypothetical protein TgHK011_003695 [Trichoderma gracile]|nr:hypothetical protein TgHK011_003695 [Trichoderma gracile]
MAHEIIQTSHDPSQDLSVVTEKTLAQLCTERQVPSAEVAFVSFSQQDPTSKQHVKVCSAKGRRRTARLGFGIPVSSPVGSLPAASVQVSSRKRDPTTRGQKDLRPMHTSTSTITKHMHTALSEGSPSCWEPAEPKANKAATDRLEPAGEGREGKGGEEHNDRSETSVEKD